MKRGQAKSEVKNKADDIESIVLFHIKETPCPTKIIPLPTSTLNDSDNSSSSYASSSSSSSSYSSSISLLDDTDEDDQVSIPYRLPLSRHFPQENGWRDLPISDIIKCFGSTYIHVIHSSNEMMAYRNTPTMEMSNSIKNSSY